MPGKPQRPSPYPPCVHPKHGALYYVRFNRWTRIIGGLKWTREADIALARLKLEEAPGGNRMADMLNGYLKHCRDDLLPAGDLAARTVEDKKSEILNLIGFFGKMDPKAVLPHHVGAYKKRRGAASRVQCNHELSTLSSAFAWGMEEGLAPANPCKGIRRWRVRPRRELPSTELVDAFLTWGRAQGELGQMCAIAYDLAYLTTQRKGDIIRIRTSAINDAENGGITFLQRKGNETVEVTIEWTARLRAVVAEARAWRRQYRSKLRQRRVKFEQRAALASVWLFCNRNGKPYTDQGFAATYGKVSREWVKLGNARVRWHDGTRARGTTKLKKDGRQAHEVTGHHTEQTVERIYDRRKQFRGRAVE